MHVGTAQAIDVKITLQQEPWRGLQGQPRNCLDPMWAGAERPECKATVDDINWEGETGFWWCRKCGYCSNGQRLGHCIPQNPVDYLRDSKALFTEQRRKQGLSDDEIQLQMDHITGVVLREAAARTPQEFALYIATFLQPA